MGKVLPDEPPTDTSHFTIYDEKPKGTPYMSPNIYPYVQFVGLVSVVLLIIFAASGALVHVENKRIEQEQARLGEACTIYEKTIVIEVPQLCLEYFAKR